MRARQRRRRLIAAVIAWAIIPALCVIFGPTSDAMGAGSIIEFKDDFTLKNPGQQLPYGKSIVIMGYHEKTIEQLKVTTSFGVREQSVDATITDAQWSAQVGPFPVGQEVVFRFEMSRKIPHEAYDSIRIALYGSVMELFNSIRARTVSMDKAEFDDSLRAQLSRRLPDEYKSYFDKSGMTLHELIPMKLVPADAKTATPVSKMLDALEEIRTRSQTLNDLSKEIQQLVKGNINSLNQTKTFWEEILKNLDDQLDTLAMDNNLRKLCQNTLANSQFPSAVKSKLTTKLSVIDTKVSEIRSRRAIIYSNMNDILNAFKLSQKTAIYHVSAMSDAEVSPLEDYAGFDVAALWTPGADAVSGFFIVNIHLEKIALDEGTRKRFLQIFGLSAGIAIASSDIDADGNTYFLGIGARLNKYFRFSTGTVFFKPGGGDEFRYYWTGGFSLNFRRVNDLIRIFTGAASNFENKH